MLKTDCNSENKNIINILNTNDIIICACTGNIELDLIFKHKIDLPQFSCIDLLKTSSGKEMITNCILKYIDIIKKNNIYGIIDTQTFRCSKKWGELLNCNEEEIRNLNKEAIKIINNIKNKEYNKIIINGSIGPINDGYIISKKLKIEELEKYHEDQISTLFNFGADIITAFTMNYVEEAIGITFSAKKINAPLIICFTLEIDGKLPSGMSLEEAINKVDETSNYYPMFYMINCVHPKYFVNVLFENRNKKWIKRIKGIKPNPSTKTHEELNNSTELDSGDINGLSSYCENIRKNFKHINIYGGCCGSDEVHIEEIYEKVKLL